MKPPSVQMSSFIELSPPGISISEPAGNAMFFISRSVDSASRLAVDYATSNSTARAELDYTAVSGTLVREPSETTKWFSVPIVDDGLSKAEVISSTQTNP